MKSPAPHTTLLTLLTSWALLLVGGSTAADEPVDAADEAVPALTEAVVPDVTPADSADEATGDAGPGRRPGRAQGSGADTEDTAPAATETAAQGSASVAQEGNANAGTTSEHMPAAAEVAGTSADDGIAIDTLPDADSDASLAVTDAAVDPGDDGIAIDALPDADSEAARPVAEAFGNPEDSGVAIDTLSNEPAEQTRVVPLAAAVTVADETTAHTLTLLKADIVPGTYQRLSWAATEMFEDLPVATPVLVVNGKSPGPTLCLTAAVHGDELNGIEMVRRVMHDLNPQKLSGAVIGVPIVNLQGFRRGSRYLPDRRDLNRYFPGNPRGSAAARIAHSFFTEVIEHCDALVDLHTGSFDRANLPQLRADLRNPDVVTLTQGFGATVILHSEPAEGTLRAAASDAGIPTVTLEAGGPSELELKEVMHGVKGIETLLNTLGMVDKARLWGDQQPVYYRSSWVRANRGGILLADVSLGSTVRRGDLLGTITDPMNNASTNLYSPYSGRVIGMARNQVVMPGFAAFHVGIQAVDATAVDNDDPQSKKGSKRKDETLALEGDSSNSDYVDGMSE